MNCHQAQRWLSARQDGALDPARVARLAAHVASCAACRRFEQQLAALKPHWQARPETAVPTPEAAWADVQRGLRLQGAEERPAVVVPWARWARVAVMLCVLAALGAVLDHVWSGFSPVGEVTAAPATKVLRATTELAGASTMVYEDQQTGWAVVWVMPAEDGNHARM
ncbi:MAG: zf-HC2 domain-containing protein [Lentisphaerae bacterium]|nr:zf-HC2 domain-containing protein [Lentisphaerota bacterium]